MPEKEVTIRKTVRCAVYTRKSTEDGLEQEFNSLDAQREAGEAYIASQKGEGWRCLPEHYDDGGFTGGNTDRPALQRMLEDIKAKKLDCVVVYKVDRLSRSLLDFAKLMDLFDKHDVTFVSVTQQFSTSNSMGRLTLNILLSFAQFEREIIAERTKDKMSAARKKGKWMGGMMFLGYDVAPGGGRLLINPDEAEQVRTVFRMYIELENMTRVLEEVKRRCWRTKQWTAANGREHGGKEYQLCLLYKIIKNVSYLGKVEYEGKVYDGEHEAIVSEELWLAAQRILKAHSGTQVKHLKNKNGEILRGLLWCTHCQAVMVMSVIHRKTKVYRYYVCRGARQNGWNTCPAKSLNAAEIEEAVVNHIKTLGGDSQLVKQVTTKFKNQCEIRLKSLLAEEKQLNQQIARLGEQYAKALAKGNLVERQKYKELIAECEHRQVEVAGEKSVLQGRTPSITDISNAMSEFETMWSKLPRDEQAKVLHQIIKRINYDAEAGRVTIDYNTDKFCKMIG